VSADNRQQKNQRVLIYLFLGVIGMFAFGYAMVPFYNVLCRTLGINGKTGGQSVASHRVDKSRTVEVQFITMNNSNLRNWKFYPLQKIIMVHPGQNAKVAFYAENDTNHKMTVQAIPSVTPGVAANYLKKTECFCFTQQTLKAHEGVKMPLLFHLDTDLPKNITVMTLSYTLFDVTGQKARGDKKAGRLG